MKKFFSTPARRILLGVGATAILVGSAVGIAAAQQATPSPTTGQQRPGAQAFLAALAKRLNITTDQLNQAISGARQDVGLPANGAFPGRGRGPGGPGGFGMGRFGGEFNAAAQAIGITVDQLRAELPGKTLTQVAQNHGKNPADVATALKDAFNQRVDQAVTNGRLTADQATQIKQRGDQRIDQLMTRVVPQGGPGRGRGPGSNQPASSTS
jgi:hypothetical protein